MPVRATGRGGRLVVDEPTELPEGTVLNVVVDHEGDELGDEERAALDAALSTSWRQAQAGPTMPAEAILERLRSRRVK